MYIYEQNTTTLTKREDSDAKKSNDLPIILGAIFGGLFCAIIIGWGIWYHLRWRRRQRLIAGTPRRNKPPSALTIDPFILDPPKATIPHYRDYAAPSNIQSYGLVASSSSGGPSSSSGAGSRYGAQSQASSSTPALSPIASHSDFSRARASSFSTPPTSVAPRYPLFQHYPSESNPTPFAQEPFPPPTAAREKTGAYRGDAEGGGDIAGTAT
ncbi:hypothetical protein V5O48_010524 [Marasmius crinis-equi]|uniref:Uncharacterized protein n=1 Tax=Marasmius crinis-equi TaxID=585013 RepID=A0ABR3F838_9AGAR